MVSANGTVINHNVPCPQSYGIPLERRGEKEKQFWFNLQWAEIIHILQNPMYFWNRKAGIFKKKQILEVQSNFSSWVQVTMKYIPLTNLSDTMSPSNLKNKITSTVPPAFLFSCETNANIWISIQDSMARMQLMPNPQFWRKGQSLGERPIQMPLFLRGIPMICSSSSSNHPSEQLGSRTKSLMLLSTESWIIFPRKGS